MGNYVFNTSFLYEQLIKDADTDSSTHDFGKDIIPSIVDMYRVYAFPFRDQETSAQAYWRDVGTLDAFWEANMELIGVHPQLNLYDQKWPVFTDQAQLPPAKFVFDQDDRRGQALDSMVSAGCIISGASVRRSVLFSGCSLHSWATVEDSVILPDCDIGQHCNIRNAILDRGTQVPEGTEIGIDHEADRERGFRVTEGGRTLVTPDMLGQSLHFTR